MKIGIIGSGVVGQTLGLGLIAQGHDVKIGTRDPAKLKEWAAKAGHRGSVGSFADAAAFGEVIFIATLWMGTKSALELAKKENFENKIVVDVTNPLDFSTGALKPAAVYPLSASEQIQKWLPDAKIAKAFNTVPAPIITNPKFTEGTPDLFIAGHDDAKKFVTEIAKKWGWGNVIDMGDLSASYLIEGLAMLSIGYGVKYNDWMFAYKFLRK